MTLSPASPALKPSPGPESADLARCEDEPIRIPGAIQPHGRLLVIDIATGGQVAWSANWPEHERHAAVTELLARGLQALPEQAFPVPLGSFAVGEGARMQASAHARDGRLIVEFEPPYEEPAHGSTSIYTVARAFMPRLQAVDSIEDLAELAVAEMKQLSGFGRCLLYRFDENDDGHVLAEVAEDGYERYTGHHFPAADIPAQARDLYTLNHFRIIPDANYTPVPLVGPGSERPVDLSQSGLRSVSPVHLEYMRNMGTLASMSVSLVVQGRLWGLISCHNHQPRHLAPTTRLACEHLGRLVSLQIQAKESNASAAQRLELRKLILEIVSHLSDSDASLQRLLAEPAPLLRLARAAGAAVVLDDEVWTTGETPPKSEVLALASWIAGLEEPVYANDALSPHTVPSWAAGQEIAGCLAVSISQVHRHLVLWFRPEHVRTITWAGDPRKEVRPEDGRLHPRRSFSSWAQKIRGRSLSWTAEERAAADELRQALIGIVLRRAEEMAAVATELSRVNRELEAFSYTVSHDLRAPMRHIAGFVDLVVDMEGRQLSERALRYLSNVKDAAAFAGELVDALLDFSRMGRTALKLRPLKMADLIEGLIHELSRGDAGRGVQWKVDAPLPVLEADPLLLQVATRNLLANALKYTRGASPAVIQVRAIREADGSGIEVEDNGVGFEMKYVGKLFGVFQRLHAAEEFEGTGIGLANVKRIVERHGGRVWAHGEPGRGARFGFVLPPHPPGPAQDEPGELHA